ncbi:MAG: hypothetical protein R3281_14095 [Balneolaceae bacterium]|nr:hypothetical protein [Balneolaceae bacterium]
MDWEDIGRGAGKFFLAALEYCFKICAFVAAAIAINTQGVLTDKISNSFTALPLSLRRLLELPGELMEMGTIIHDYHSQTIAAFTKAYGVGATNNVLQTLNGAVEYVIGVYNNVTQSPLSTMVAMLVVFSTFYLLARVLRFARQRGEGSYLTRLERKLAAKVYGRNPASRPYIAGSAKPIGAGSDGKAGSRRSMKKPIKKRAHSNISIANKPGFRQRAKSFGSYSNKEYGPDPERLNYLLDSARS